MKVGVAGREVPDILPSGFGPLSLIFDRHPPNPF